MAVDQEVQHMLVRANKQLHDANKMLHAFMCAILTQKFNGSVTLDMAKVQEDFHNYNVTWKPIVEGSNAWLLKAEPIVKTNFSSGT